MMTPETYHLLRDRFRGVFEAKWSRDELPDYDDLREKFALHMADAMRNLTVVADRLANPVDCDAACLTERIELLFNECVPHLMAAAQIYDEIPLLFAEQRGVHAWDTFVDDAEPPA
jgi:hypothetical protein